MAESKRRPGRVVLYSQPRCGNCEKVKEFLTAQQIPFEEKDVGHNREALLELVEVHKSQITPTTLVGEQVIVGYDRRRLVRALGLA